MISKPSKSGEMLKLTIGLYRCNDCGKSFRLTEGKEKITMKGILDRSNSLEAELMEATKKRAELEERIQALENEKACLSAEIEALKMIPTLEEKASSLESTVSRLREEKEALLARVNDLLPKRTSPSLEKPLEAYISQEAPEVQPIDADAPIPDALTAEPEVAACTNTVVEVVPLEAIEATGVEESCDTTMAEATVLEKPAECTQLGPIVTKTTVVDVLASQPTQVDEAPSEVTISEPELSPLNASVPEPISVESKVVEHSTEAGVIEEKPIETLPIEILKDSIIEIEQPTSEKFVEAPAPDVTRSETPPTPEKAEEQPIQPVITITSSAESPTMEVVSPAPSVNEENIVKTIVLESTPKVESTTVDKPTETSSTPATINYVFSDVPQVFVAKPEMATPEEPISDSQKQEQELANISVNKERPV
jgi:hypothetical protein